ncbi:MAG: hypothetical protein ACI9EW_003806 [Cellvibrionaceae bacterium]|jgi:hypothetical protein
MNKNNPTQSPLEIVNQRMAAHNNHDLVAFLALYSDDIQIYNYPNTAIGRKGKAHIKSIFEPLFSAATVSVEIHHQIEQGKYVINEETVTRQGKTFRYISVYEVMDGLILSVRFIREN